MGSQTFVVNCSAVGAALISGDAVSRNMHRPILGRYRYCVG